MVLPPFHTAQRVGAATARDTISSGGGYGYNHNNVIKFISFYDKENKRYKTIDLNGQPHYIDGKKEKEHTHFGYIHDEQGTKSLSDKEKKLIDRITSVWNNRHGKQ